MTQRTASTRLDLPQPFGPTTPVSPGSISKSVGSTKDLKPIRRSRVSFIRFLCPSPGAAAKGIVEAHAEAFRSLWRGEGAASARRMNRHDSERNSGCELSRLSRWRRLLPAVGTQLRAAAGRRPKNPYPSLR